MHASSMNMCVKPVLFHHSPACQMIDIFAKLVYESPALLFLACHAMLASSNVDAQLYASVCRISTPLQDGSRASTPGSKMSQATSGMREVAPDGNFYLRVGTQWVKVGIPLLSLAVLAALLTS